MRPFNPEQAAGASGISCGAYPGVLPFDRPLMPVSSFDGLPK